MLFDFDVLLHQMLSFYTMILAGFLGYQIKLFHDAELAALSRLTVHIFLPLMVLTSIINTVQSIPFPSCRRFFFRWPLRCLSCWGSAGVLDGFFG